MKILLIHADHFEYEVKEKAIRDPEKISDQQKTDSVDEVLVVYCAVEKTDESDTTRVVQETADSIEDVAKSVKTENIVVYPYAHLSSNLGSPQSAVTLLKQLEEELIRRGLKTKRSPFGWYKSFKISCKGHPLSELSRTIVPKEPAKIHRPVETVHKILTQNMELQNPVEYVYRSGEEDFKALVDKEALKKQLPGGKEPRFLKYCSKFGVQWEPYSDLGHMRYGPEANLIFELICDYAGQLVDSLPIPAFHVRGTNMFNLSVPAVKEHAELFGGRLYELNIEDKQFLLRYAACHQQFAMIKDWILSYKDLPLGAFEIADSYRLEQEGELLLCFRLRKLHMPDFHIFCKNLNESQTSALMVHKKIYEEIRKLGLDYVSIYNVTESYFNQHQDFFKQLLKIEKKPVLLNFVPELYYWVLNVEYNIIDELGRPREIG
ncbi:MAG: threonine--tRNA ligase, partial [Candidatus Bathyarchaeota archaeon]